MSDVDLPEPIIIIGMKVVTSTQDVLHDDGVTKGIQIDVEGPIFGAEPYIGEVHILFAADDLDKFITALKKAKEAACG